MTTYSRAVEHIRREVRGVLMDALRLRRLIVVDDVVGDELELHLPLKHGGQPFVTDSQGRKYTLGPTGRLIVERN